MVKVIRGVVFDVPQIECPCPGHCTELAPCAEVILITVVCAVTSLVSWGNFNAAPAFVNRVMVFNLLACGDGLLTEVANHKGHIRKRYIRLADVEQMRELSEQPRLLQRELAENNARLRQLKALMREYEALIRQTARH